nr:hypothetical protein [Micromonospora sp. DSM 115978]
MQHRVTRRLSSAAISRTAPARPEPGDRPARAGETCTCGRRAVVVYRTERFGDVGHCGA